MARPGRRATGGVVIDTRGNVPRYGIRFRDQHGRRRYESLGAVSEAEADKELDRRLAEVTLGTYKPVAPTLVEEPAAEPTFLALASEWVARREHEVDARTVEHWRWALSNHLLPLLANYRPSELTVALVEKFKSAKLAERQQQQTAIERWRTLDPKTRARQPFPGLSHASINKCLKVLAQVLDDAVEFGYVETNVARGKRRRLKATKPRRTWLELHEVQALLAVAGKHRPLIATMILAGLRVGELTALRWRDVDLAGGKLRVADAKTDAGVRVVDLTPMLLDELKLHRADSEWSAADAVVFGTNRGTERNRSNITRQIVQPAIERANVELAKAGRTPIEHVTNHSLRRTFCALLYEAGATPAYVMAQMGHTDASLALEVYTKVMERTRDTGVRMDTLILGADRAATGSNGAETVDPTSAVATENPAGAGLF